MGYQESPSLVVPEAPQFLNGSGRCGRREYVVEPNMRFKTRSTALEISLDLMILCGRRETYRTLRAVFPPHKHL